VSTEYDALAELASSPRRELHCHPAVVEHMRDHPWAPKTGVFPGATCCGGIGDLLGIPVFEHAEYRYGQWELCEDDEVVASAPGMLETGDGKL
jgi:hypothetical protein